MFCQKCGKEIHDEAVICVHCGCEVKPSVKQQNAEDIPSTGLNVLAFFLPLVGLILYLVWHDKTPKRARSIGKWALISVIVSIVGYILLVAVGLAL